MINGKDATVGHKSVIRLMEFWWGGGMKTGSIEKVD